MLVTTFWQQRMPSRLFKLTPSLKYCLLTSEYTRILDILIRLNSSVTTSLSVLPLEVVIVSRLYHSWTAVNQVCRGMVCSLPKVFQCPLTVRYLPGGIITLEIESHDWTKLSASLLASLPAIGFQIAFFTTSSATVMPRVESHIRNISKVSYRRWGRIFSR